MCIIDKFLCKKIYEGLTNPRVLLHLQVLGHRAVGARILRRRKKTFRCGVSMTVNCCGAVKENVPASYHSGRDSSGAKCEFQDALLLLSGTFPAFSPSFLRWNWQSVHKPLIMEDGEALCTCLEQVFGDEGNV